MKHEFTPPKIKKLTPLQAAREEHRSLLVSFNALKSHMEKAVEKESEMKAKYDFAVRRLDEILGDKERLNNRVDALIKEIEELRSKTYAPTVKFENNKIIITYEN